MKNLFVLLLMTSLQYQCLAQNHSSNYLDSLNKTREKVLWIVQYSKSKIVTTYNLIFLRDNIDFEYGQTIKEHEKLHPKAWGVVEVHPNKKIKFLNLKEMCLKYKIPLDKMNLPISVDDEMIEDPADIIVDKSNIKSVIIAHNKEINSDVIQISNVTETVETKYKKEYKKFLKEHPNEIWDVR
jgi:hypothetical protein